MSSKKTITRDAMLFLPAKVAEGLLVIACSSLYTHIFTKNAVGVFGIVNTTVQLCYLILAGWMANATTRYVGEEHRADGGRALFSTVAAVYLALCAVAGGAALVAALTTGNRVWLGGAAMLAGYTCFQILNSALIQLGRMGASIGLSLFSAAGKLAIAYALCRGQAAYPSAAPAIVANLIADGLAGLGAIFALSLPKLVRARAFSPTLLRRFFAYGTPLLGVSVAVALLNMIDRYLVTGFFGEAVFAVYNSNNSIASGIFTMLSVGVMRGVYPAVLRGWREGGKQAVQPLLDHGVRLYLLLAVPAVAGLWAVSLPLSQFLFAQGYETGAPIIGLTALAMLMMGLTEYANKAYELEQKTMYVLQNSLCAAVVKVVCSIVLLRVFGFIGGAIGSVVAFTTYFVLTAWRVRTRFLFRVSVRTLMCIAVSAALCGAAAYGCTLLPIGTLARLGLAVAAGAVTYAVVIILSGEGRGELRALLARRKG